KCVTCTSDHSITRGNLSTQYLTLRHACCLPFPTIPAGNPLRLRAGGNLVSFQRTDSGVNCPHPDFRLDNRLLGYEVLQHCPFEMYIGLGVLGSSIHLEGREVILKTVLLFTECTATLYSAGT